MPELCRRFAAHLRGTPVAYDDVPVDDDGLSRVPARAARGGTHRRLGRGRHLRRARRARRQAEGRARGGQLLRGEPPLARRPVPPHRRRRAGRAVRARWVRAVGARASSVGCSRSKGRSCERRLARGRRPGRARRARADPALRPAGRALRALPHGGDGAPPRQGGALVPPRPGRVVGRAARVRDPETAPRRRRRFAPTTAARSTGPPARSSSSRDRRTRSTILSEAGVLSREGLPLDRPPGHVVARPCCRSAYLRGAFLGGGSLSGPRSPHLEVRTPLHAGAAFVRSVASAAGRQDARPRPGDPLGRVREELGRDRGLPVRRRRHGDRPRSRGASARRRPQGRREPRRERRPREPRSPEPIGARAVRGCRRRCGTPELLAGLAPTLQDAAELRLRHPSLSLRELAARTDPPVTKAAMAGRLARLVALAAEELQPTSDPG